MSKNDFFVEIQILLYVVEKRNIQNMLLVFGPKFAQGTELGQSNVPSERAFNPDPLWIYDVSVTKTALEVKLPKPPEVREVVVTRVPEFYILFKNRSPR